MYMQEMDYELRCRFYFSAIWKFMLGNRDKCLAFVRYYYSPYFTRYSAENHKRRYKPLVDKFKDAFKDEADVWMIRNQILNVMLDFAVKVHNDQMPKEDNYAEHVFRVIYQSVKQYFRKNEESDSEYEESTKHNQNNLCVVDGFAGSNNDDLHRYFLHYFQP